MVKKISVKLDSSKDWIPTDVNVIYVYLSPLEVNPFAGETTEQLQTLITDKCRNEALRQFARNYEKLGLFVARLNHLFEAIELFEAIKGDHLTETDRLEYWDMLFNFLDIYIGPDNVYWVVPNDNFLRRCEPEVELNIENGLKLSRSDCLEILKKRITKKE